MNSTHITKTKDTHIDPPKTALRLGLLATFLMCFLWGVHSCQATAMVNVKHSGGDQDEENKQQQQDLLKKALKFLQTHWRTIAAGTATAAAVAAVAWAILGPSNAAQSAVVTAPPPTNVPLPVPLPVAPETVAPPTSIIEKMASFFTFDGGMDDSASLIDGLRKACKAAAEVVTKSTEVVPAVVKTAAEAVKKVPPPKTFWGQVSDKIKDIVPAMYKGLTANGIATLAGIAAIGKWLYSRSIKDALSVGRDCVVGWGVAPVGGLFLNAAQMPLFSCLAGPSAWIGRWLFSKTDMHKKVQGAVGSVVETVLPNRDTVAKLMPNEKLKRWIKKHWGGEKKGADSGNNAKGAAKAIGGFVANLVGCLIGVVLLAIIIKVWGWYHQAKNHAYAKEPTSQSPSTIDPPKAYKEPQPDKEAVEKIIQESLLLHIIWRMGCTEICYSLVDKVIKKLEERTDKFTQHQRYNPQSRFKQLKEDTMKWWAERAWFRKA